MKTVTLRYYAAGNLGDDLFIKMIAERYDGKFSYRQYWRTGTLSKIDNLEGYGSLFTARVQLLLDRLVGVANTGLLLRARKNGIVVYIGGSIFINDGDPARWRREERFFRAIRGRYHILGMSYGEEVGTRFHDHVRAILRAAADVCVRDQASYSRLEPLSQLRLATDVVMAMDPSPYVRSPERLVVVSVIDTRDRFDAATSENYERVIADAASQFATDGYRVVLMSFCDYERDHEAATRIRIKAPEHSLEIYRYSGNLDEALELIGRSEVVIGSRFHANVLGILLGKRVLPIAYSDKTIDLLRDLGYEGVLVDLRSLDGESRILAADPQHFSGFDRNRARMLAEEQFSVLDTLLPRRIVE